MAFNFAGQNIGNFNKFALLLLCQPCIQFCLYSFRPDLTCVYGRSLEFCSGGRAISRAPKAQPLRGYGDMLPQKF